jgi:hypothetical protein
MKLHYLCENHRQQLFAKPQLALQYWQLWISKGCKLYEQLDFVDAVRFLGCAFELANHLLHRPRGNTAADIARFTYSSICLSRAYEQVGDKETQGYLIEYADRCMTALNQGFDEWFCRCQQSLAGRADSIYWVNESLRRVVLLHHE